MFQNSFTIFSRRSIHLVAIFVTIASMLFGGIQGVAAQGEARFHVQMVENNVKGYAWPVGFPVTLTIEDETGIVFSDTQPVIPDDNNPTIGRVHFNDLGGIDLAPGMFVTVENGTIIKTHTITNLVVTEVNVDADMVSGTGTPGAQLNIQYCGDDGCLWRRWATVQPDASWEVDFSVTGPGPDEQLILDIVPGIFGEALEPDGDSDHTDYQWGVINPNINAQFDGNWISGENWTLGSIVHVEVDDPANGTGVDFSDSGLVAPDPDFPDSTWIQFDLGSFQLAPGQSITVWDDPYTITKTLSVSGLVVTSIDLDNDVISGTTDSSDIIYVVAWCNDMRAVRMINPVNGAWSADFSVGGNGFSQYEQVIHDLTYGCYGPIHQSDAEDDSTMRHWNAGNPPTFVANLSNNQIYSENWVLGSNVNITIDDASNGVGIDYSDSGIVGEAPWGDPNFTWVEFNLGDFILEPSDIVVMSGNSIAKELIVQPLEITEVDLDQDTLYGMTEPDFEISVWVRKAPGEWAQRTVVAANDGSWTADFSVAGPLPKESLIVDIKNGTLTSAAHPDLDGDTTEVEWRIPNPTISASVKDNYIWGDQWPEGETVTMTIDDPSNGQGVDYQQDQISGPAPWDPDWAYVQFDLGNFQLQSGHLVEMTNGPIIKSLLVQFLEVTDVNLEADTISGLADPGVEVMAYVQGQNGWAQRWVTSDIYGNWSADFSVPGPSDNEQDMADITYGMYISTQRPDEDGDSTEYRWMIPSYTLHAVPSHPEVHGHDWPAGSDVTLNIDDDADPNNGTLYTQIKNTDDDPWCGNPCFDLLDVFDLQVGQYVTMADGQTSKTVQVSVLEITEVNPDNETISGMADPGSRVAVNIWSQDGQARYETADVNGTWTADFSALGDEDFEQFTTDIGIGDNGHAIQLNPDGSDDGTLQYWEVVVPQCQPGASVSGTVFEHDGLTPIPFASLQIEDYYTGEIRFATGVNQNGQFGCSLPDGDYRILALADNYSQEYFDQARDTNATLLHIAAGTQLADINFTLSHLPTMEHFTFNLENPLLQDSAVRQAMALGTDRQRILNEAFLPNNNWGVVSNSIVPPEHWAAAPSSTLTLYTYDPTQSRAILDAAGWIDRDDDGFREDVNGVELAFTFKTTDAPLRVASSEIFRQNMEQIGVRIMVENIPAGEFFADGGLLEQGSFDIVEFAWAMGFDDETYLEGYVTSHAQNHSSYSNPAFDAAMANALAAVGDAEKIPYYIEAQAILTQDLPILPLFTRYTVAPVQTSAGSNVNVSPEEYLDIHFDTVTESGATTVIAIDVSPVELPPNFQLLGQVYDLGTSAQFSTAQVCFTYDDAGLSSSEEQAVRLFHLEDNAWTDVTDAGYPDLDNNLVCGTVSSFSPFAVIFGLNQAPQITNLTASVAPVQIGQSITATAAFNDPNAGDTHTALWDWGDGSTTTVSATSPSVSAFHNYASPGVYTITTTVTDAAGESDSASFQYVVIYDPNGGYVTGGGWINSPSGAYTPDSTLTGKATFGFVSKYKKGANVPDGNTEFQFKVADLNFRSTSYDWLVIAGTKAQYKGTGTINGGGNYGFLLTANDGTPDKFRIKIWDKSTGDVIYDNMLGAADDANPATEIQGGSIVIHKDQ